MSKIKKYFFLYLYKIFAIHLPPSTVPYIGKYFKRFRYFCCKRIFLKCGKNVNIEKGAKFGNGFNLEIGDNSGIGIYCTIPNDIIIGRNVMMGPRCYILSQNHDISDISKPMCECGFIKKKTLIEDDVWIGRQVIFTPGRILKKGSVVAAGCVLCKDFPEYSVIGGNPARLIKSRLK